MDGQAGDDEDADVTDAVTVTATATAVICKGEREPPPFPFRPWSLPLLQAQLRLITLKVAQNSGQEWRQMIADWVGPGLDAGWHCCTVSEQVCNASFPGSVILPSPSSQLSLAFCPLAARLPCVPS